MTPDRLIKLLARASGVELHEEEGGDRHVVSIKFDEKTEACKAWDALCELEGDEDCD